MTELQNKQDKLWLLDSILWPIIVGISCMVIGFALCYGIYDIGNRRVSLTDLNEKIALNKELVSVYVKLANCQVQLAQKPQTPAETTPNAPTEHRH